MSASLGPRPEELREWLGDIDIYLLDQLLKGRIRSGMTVLDAGCGSGRNLLYLLRSDLDVYGVDSSAEAIRAVRELAENISPALSPDHFEVHSVEALPFGPASFDAVLSSAVLHFATGEDHFRAMVGEMWRVLRPGGLLFTRLASTIGLESRARPLGGRRFRLPDGSERFLVDEPLLLSLTEELDGMLADPLKTTNVQNLRCMTTWCLFKEGPR